MTVIIIKINIPEDCPVFVPGWLTSYGTTRDIHSFCNLAIIPLLVAVLAPSFLSEAANDVIFITSLSFSSNKTSPSDNFDKFGSK